MNRMLSTLAGVLCLCQSVWALDPISASITSNTLIPAQSTLGSTYLVTYTLVSNLPFTMPSAFNNSFQTGHPLDFIVDDQCQGKTLAPGGSCQLTIGFSPHTAGQKTGIAYMTYGHNSIPIGISSTVQTEQLNSTWVGLIGVDYQPNHYPNGTAYNDHDVFYVGSENSVPITNVYAELAQLKAAGFTTVRSYQTVEYAWIDIILQANALGMKVVYEADIPQNGNQANITSAVNVLNNVIDAVTASTFEQSVVLLFAGHENYSNTDISYLTSAVTQLQAALTAKSVSNVPVGSALVSGDLVTPSASISADMTTLIASYSADAPLGFDPYPFQWGVTPPDQAVSNITLINAIAWDYAQVQSQSFYVPPRAILMAETGWATSGVGTFAGYFCATNNTCAPSVANAGTYLTALYAYVNTPSNNAGALVFEAYDEPAKDPVNPTNAENFYGVFDTNCNLKGSALIPNTSFSGATYPGCQGFTSGALFNVVGGDVLTQPQFQVGIVQTNPVTMADAGMTVTVPNLNRTNMNVNSWPYFAVYNGAVVTMTGSGTGNSCDVTVTVAGSSITGFSAVTCTGAVVVNCNVGLAACFLPANF